MFTLLKVPKSYALKGILHLRSDGTIVKELFINDSDLTYQADDGEFYSFFIINAEYGDTIQYSNFKHSLISLTGFNEVDTYESSCEISEMCIQLLKQGYSLPDNIDNLLKDKLSMCFDGIIQYHKFGFNSYTVWKNYEWILRHLGKKASDYVSQEKLDTFINMLISKYEIEQVENISQSNLISIGIQSIECYVKATEEIENTIQIVKNYIFNYCNSDNFTKQVFCVMIDIKSTPCGKVKVHIKNYGHITVTIAIINNGNNSKTVLNISEKCEEFNQYFT